MKKKLDLLVVVLLFIVALFLIAIGSIVTWETKNITELVKYISMACFIVMEAYVYHELHIGGNGTGRWEK